MGVHDIMTLHYPQIQHLIIMHEHFLSQSVCHTPTKTLEVEVDRLIMEAGVLWKVNHSEWAAPTFIIPTRKDGLVRFISYFWEMNQRIKRKPYLILKIQDLLLKLEGFQYTQPVLT
jgi:hypothetical protein